jgi:isoleucyl-tRNA synthetase
MLLEGFDQHNRWFLSSLILSMALTDEAPFKVLKTHGLLVDQSGDKISKSAPLIDDGTNEVAFNPEDFLEGSAKMDGERKFGYGIDVMRAWCATKDTDRNMHIMKGQLDRVNKEVKLFRDILRVLLTHLQTFNLDNSMEKFDFNKNLTFVDKMMIVRTLEFSK